MTGKIKAGVFSPGDPRPWVKKESIGLLLKHETFLLEALRGAGIAVVRGGEGLPRADQVAWNTELVRKHIKRIAAERPDALIINQGSWTFPYDSVDAVKTFMNETGDIARVVIFSYKDTKVPGLVAGMAAGGGLKRIGVPFVQCYGRIDRDSKVLGDLTNVLKFYKRRAESAETARKAISALGRQKYMAFGGMSLKMSTTTADVDQWQKLFGISYEALDQSEMVIRALRMVRWEGKPGESNYEILDRRMKAALNFLKKHGRFDFSGDKMRSIHKFVHQLALYYAAFDLCNEYGATFAGINARTN